MPTAKLVTVLSIGPGQNLDYARDTLESVYHYAPGSHATVLVDDSGEGVGKVIGRQFPRMHVLTNARQLGRYYGLYTTIGKGLSFVARHFRCEIVLKLDTDALVIESGAEDVAIALACASANVGSIGSWLRDCNGVERDFRPHARLLGWEVSDAHLATHPERAPGIEFLRRRLLLAFSHGYIPGEHCQGGAHFITPRCICRLDRARLFAPLPLAWTRLEDDVLFGLMIRSEGFCHADLATGDLPLGVRWRGLPGSPEDLVMRHKRIIHSTKSDGDRSEDAVRAFFRARRVPGPGQGALEPESLYGSMRARLAHLAMRLRFARQPRRSQPAHGASAGSAGKADEAW